MPRNGSGVYSLPAGSTFSPTTVIESSKVNALTGDLEADQNTARPVVAGGTGATSASAARTSLGAAASGANTDITAVYLNNTGLKIKDTNASHGLSIVPGSDLTADRSLTLVTGDAARTITLSGNPTLADWFDQSVKQAATVVFAALTVATLTLGATAITATGAELNFTDGVTSNIQTQLDAKAPLASPTFTGAVTATTIELGHASDTTLSRVSAGLIAVEGQTVPMLFSANTWTANQIIARSGASSITQLQLSNSTDGAAALALTLLSRPSAGASYGPSGPDSNEILSSGGTFYIGTDTSNDVSFITGNTVRMTVLSGGAVHVVSSLELGNASDTTLARVSAGVVSIEGVTIATASNTLTLTNKTLTSPTLTTPVLGTPSSGTLTSCTGLPVSTGISGLGAGVATFLATPSSANLAAAVTDETGSGALVFGTAPTFAGTVTFGSTPVLAIASGGVLNFNSSDVTLTHAADMLNVGINAATIARFVDDGTSKGLLISDGTPVGNPASGTQDGVQLTYAGQVITSNTSNTAAAFRRQGTDGAIIGFYKLTANVGTITVTGAATAYNTSSDERLKYDFADFDSGEIIDRAKVYDFAWKSGDGRAYGVKAQELYDILPQAVSPGRGEPGDADYEPWGVDYSKFVPVHHRELQALRSRVRALEAMILPN